MKLTIKRSETTQLIYSIGELNFNLNIKILMLTYNMRRTALVLILAIAIASTQNTTNNSTDLTLRLSSEKQVSIEGGKSVTLTMKIDMKVNNETESLFITAESPYGDPFE